MSADKKRNMTVQIGRMTMRNPVMVASGTFGYGSEYGQVVDLSQLGAVVVKGISAEPWEGNPPARMVEVTAGLVNAIGLQNPGGEAFIKQYMRFLEACDTCVVVNAWGRTVEEYAAVAGALDGVDGVDAIELNVSCPNIKKGGIAFGTDPGELASVVAAARDATGLTLIVKLPPNVPDMGALARVAEDNGADAVSLINSLPAMVIDIKSRRPALANVTGGLTGPAIHPVAVKLVRDAAAAVKIPVVGMGGITNAEGAVEIMLAGATAVAIGTATFTDPSTAESVVQGIEEYLVKNGIDDAKALAGALDV